MHLDRFAILISGVCLLHCLSIPLALLLGPTMGTWLLDTETDVHWILLAIAVPVSIWALSRGYRKSRNRLTLAMGYLGLTLKFAGAAHIAGAHTEVLLTSVGVIFVMVAHIRNMVVHHQHPSSV